MHKVNLKDRVLFITVSCLVIFCIALLSWERTFDTYELHTLDFRFKIRPTPEISDKISIIEISDDSIKAIGSWPFDRIYHAGLVKALKYAGAKQVIFDIFFSERKKGDAYLAEEVKKSGDVYMPYVFDLPADVAQEDVPMAEDFEVVLLKEFTKACKGTGHINIVPDQDGKFRRIPPYIEYESKLYPHISFLAVLNYLNQDPAKVIFKPQKYIKTEDFIIPLDCHSNIIVNFPGKWINTFNKYSFVDVLSSYHCELEGKKGVVDLSKLKGSICFIGLTATAEPDIHPSPFESTYPGIGVHASLYNSILTKNFIHRTPKIVNLLILIFLCLVTFVATIKARTFFSFLYLFAVVIIFILVGSILFIFLGLWIDLFYPVVVSVMLYLSLTFRKYTSEVHKREVLENELSIAKNIQQSFLPKAKPKIIGLSIESKMVTAKQVGGDLYDYVDISITKAGVMIGDVSGKGIPAALYMAKVVSEFKTYSRESTASAALLRLNDRLVSESGTNLFVTIAYLLFDMEKMKLNFSLGGHLPILMLRENEENARFLDLAEGMPLGLMESSFIDDTIDIQKGDIFILYTDGVTEAMNKKHEMFADKRLVEIVKANRTTNLKDMADIIMKEVRSFEGGLPQHDDITVIAIKVE